MSGAEEPKVPGPVNGNSRNGLKGWAYVEDWMTILDRGMVNGFNEDINTLLTFAGLFSAVLAGFLVQLYAGLQPSSNQSTNNLLSQVSSQLGQISQQLVNHSLTPVDVLLPSPGFQASASIVWINTLWFLSLDLSLAAALFGMISKQWLREYLRWTTMSGLSEDQVGLRQERYEAFKDWKTPAIIASMPVLLELALVLFLLGMEILLWTLNGVVFGICTVAVVLIILLVILATALPMFRARCPYKSPVGWAAVRARSAAFTMWNRSLDLFARVQRRFGSNNFTASQHHLNAEVEKDWRAWDLSRQTWKISSQEVPFYLGFDALGRHRMQVRALLWIAETSQDQRLLRAIEECIANPTQSDEWTPFKRLVVDLHIACDYLRIDTSTLVPPYDEISSVDEGHGDRVIDNSSTIPGSMLLFQTRLVSGDEWEERTLRVDESPSVCVWIAHILARDLLVVVSQYDESDLGCCGRQADYILQASVVLSGWLVYRAVYHQERPSPTTDLLVELFNRLGYHYDKLHPRLRPLLPLLAVSLEACGRWAPLTVASTGYYLRTCLASEPTIPAHGQPDPSAWSRADCALFAHLAQFALVEWCTVCPLDLDHRAPERLLPPLLERMTACVSRCHEQCWADCGVHSDHADANFVWPTRLRELFDPTYERFCGQHLMRPPGMFPHALVDALRRYDEDGLVTASWKSNDIAALVRASALLKNEHMSGHIPEVDEVLCSGSQHDANFAEDSEAPGQILVSAPPSESARNASSSPRTVDQYSAHLVVNGLPQVSTSPTSPNDASMHVGRSDSVEALPPGHIQTVSDTATPLNMTAAAELCH